MTDPTPLRLSELTGIIREQLQERFAREFYWVLADVSDHKHYPQKKHHYFDLVEKDETTGNLVSRISAVSWQDGTKHIERFEQETGQRFTTGIHVLIRVKVDYSALYGLKLVLLDVDTRFTLGELEQKKQETIRRLLTECADFVKMVGNRIVTRNQGHAFNHVLQEIAVLGSKQSAGYGDFMHTLEQNPYRYAFRVDTYHVSVQGEDKARELFEQLLQVFHSRKKYDAVVIIRGGGSESDFLIFNDYNLNRAIAKFPIPIITGIGHLKDQSIADLMAHTETKTPTKAAEYIIAHNKMFEDQILSVQKHLVFKAQQICSQQQRMLTGINSTVVNKGRDALQYNAREMVRIHRILTQNSMQIIHARKNEMVSLSGSVITQPRLVVGKKLFELEQMVGHLSTFRHQFIKNQRGYLQHYVSWVKMASPEHTLQRGFAIVRKDNKIITDAGEVKKGDDIVVVMHSSQLTSTVKEIKKTDGSTDHI